MITAYGKDEVTHQAKHLNISSFITKPITQVALINALMKAMGVEGQQGIERLCPKDMASSIKALGGANILLVEDNETNQELAMDLLGSNGIRVALAKNGKEAVEMVEPGEYDGVLMDCQMPVMDGYEATRMIRRDQRFAKLPIIAMTANAMKRDKEAVLAIGMNDHIAKPIDPHHLFGIMAKWIKPKNPIDIEISTQVEESETLPHLDGINTHRGLKSVMGNVGKYRELLIKFRTRESFYRYVSIGDGESRV